MGSRRSLTHFSSDRKFWVHSYTLSHGPLLLRSYEHDATPRRIDVVFSDTRAMELPLIGIDGGVEIELTTSDYLADFRSNPSALMQPGLQTYAVRGLNWEGYVLAGALWSDESDREPFGRSALIGMAPGWHLNQITLPSLDVARARDFYVKLGFRLIVDSVPNYVRLEAGGNEATLSLHKVAEMPTGETAIVYLESDILDFDVAHLKTHLGIVLNQDPQDESWLWREARLRDPDGNVICLYHAGENRLNPPWRVKPGA